MKALRWFGRGDVRLMDVDTPIPGPRDVVLQPSFCGICGTDLEEFTSGPILIPLTPHRLTGAMAPLTLGHEFTGRVSAVGSEVDNLRVGQRVVPEIALFCGKCTYCRRGQYALCVDWAAVGLHCDGGLAQYVRLPAEICVPLPDEVTDQQAALLEPLEVAVRAVRKADLKPGGSLLVMGAGPIGLLVMQVARAGSAGRIVVAEPRESRRRLALSLGASAALSPADPTFATSILEVVGSERADAAIECAGRSESIQLACESVRKAGKVVLVGLPTGRVDLDLLPVIAGELQLVGTVQHQKQDDLADAIELLQQRRVDVSALVSKVIPLASAAQALEDLTSAPGDAIKVIIATQL